MKRMWIGAALLGLLLASGLLVTGFMEETHGPSARDLDRAAALALEEDWGKARALTAKVRKNWDKARGLTAAFVDHEPMEEIEGLFSKIDACGNAGDRVGFSANCAFLARMMEALGESHSLSIRNLM